MHLPRKYKVAIAATAAALLLAAIAGAAVFALTTIRDTAQDTPVQVVGETAGAAAGAVAIVGEAAPSPLEPEPAAAAGAPDAPSATLHFTGSGEVTVRWTAPNDGGSSLTGYEVGYLASGIDPEWNGHDFSSDGSTTETVIANLSNGTQYDFRVRATNANGGGAWTLLNGVVGVPAQVAATVASSSQQLSVWWTAPSGNGNAIDDYDVRYRQSGSSSWTRISDGGTVSQRSVSGSDDAGSDDPIDFGDLGAGIARESLGGNHGLYKVPNAIDEMRLNMQADGNGGAFTARAADSKPSDLSAGRSLAWSSGGSINLWVGPIKANGYFWAAPESGTATYSNRQIEISHIDLATTTTNYVIADLSNGVEYEVQVRAGNSIGDGEWSAAVSAAPGQFTVSEITGTGATLNLAGHSGAWHYMADAAPDDSCQGPVSAGTATQTLTGLSGNASYTYSAYVDSACAILLATATTFTTPAAAEISISNVSATGATLNISGHTAAWHYMATTAPDDTCQGPVSAGAAATTLTGLSPGTSYTYSAYGDSACATLLATATAFTTPASLEAYNVARTGATLAIAGHAGAWHYKADKAPDTSCSGAVSDSAKTLTGLSAGTQYTYSAYGDSSCATLLATATAFTTLSTLSASVSNTAATLTISDYPAGTRAWYVKQLSPSEATCSSAITAQSYELSGLTDGARHSFRAYGDSGCETPATDKITFDTPLHPPADVSHYTSRCGFGSGCTTTASWKRNSDSAAGPIGYEAQENGHYNVWRDWAERSPTTDTDITDSGTRTTAFETDIRVRAYRIVNGVKLYSGWAQ